jgi:hypothetical protein
MAETEATNFLRVLLQKDPEQVQTWLRMVWTEQQQVPEKFNSVPWVKVPRFHNR